MDKIVTHELKGPSVYIHHWKISEFVTEITKKLNIFGNLYYFGKLYPKGSIPKNLPRITEKELQCKIE